MVYTACTIYYYTLYSSNITAYNINITLYSSTQPVVHLANRGCAFDNVICMYCKVAMLRGKVTIEISFIILLSHKMAYVRCMIYNFV